MIEFFLGVIVGWAAFYGIHSHYASVIKTEIQNIEQEAVADVRSAIARIKAVI